jgi:hypothetical protein
MTKEQILARVGALVGYCVGHVDGRADPQHVLSGALTLMAAVYGQDSQQVRALLKRRDEISGEAASVERKKVWLTDALHGALTNLRQEVEAGLLTSLERQIASDVLSDLLQLARLALDEATEGAKNVAAVLAAAAFEDTIRRIAKEHAGIIGRDKLDVVIDRLKNEGLLVSPQLGIALSYLSFRNHALHAEWDKIDRASVMSVLGFVQELLLKHFS